VETLRENIASIKQQLAQATMNTDPDWRRRANAAIRHKERQLQEFQIDLDDIDGEVHFISVARERLDRKIYDEIWQTVRSRRAKAHEHG
jgi:hypothetical protein